MGSITTNKIDSCSTSASAILGLALMYYKSFLPPPPKVNIVPSHTYSPVFQSRCLCFSTLKSRCYLRLQTLINFSSLLSTEEEVTVQDVFKTASSAQKSLIWKYYLISTVKNTTTHRHLAKCHYCNVVMGGKVQCMQKHM